MPEPLIARKDLDNQEFLKLRQATGKIAAELDNRLKRHLTVLRPLFIPRKLLGTYVKSSSQQEVHGSDKAFAELQEMYAAVCEQPFQLPKKLQAPLPPIPGVIECSPLKYDLELEDGSSERVNITSPTRFILSYQSECPLSRLQGILEGRESRQAEEIRQGLLCCVTLVLFLKYFPALQDLLEDLRYRIEIINLKRFGNLPVVLITAPLATFLPNDIFIQEVTQLSGIPAFQEIIDLDGVENLPDPLQDKLNLLLS